MNGDNYEDLGNYFESLQSNDDLDRGRNPHKEALQQQGIRPVNAHTCFECNGTGKYQGVRRHQEKSHCFACKGKGWFKSSYADRQKAKQKSAERKAAVQTEKQQAFIDANPGVIEGLREVCSWSEFAASLLSGFEKWGSLTDGQLGAAQRHLARIAASRAERQKEQAKKSGDVSVDAIKELFARIAAKGKTKAKFIFESLEISPAPATGRNAGAIYVKCDGEYAGKIVGDTFLAVRSAPADIKERIERIPSTLEEAIKYGRETGTCACCGRALTDPKSVARGIGPVCANWFA